MEDAWPPRLVATRKFLKEDATDDCKVGEHVANLRHVALSPDGTTVICSAVHHRQRSATIESCIIPPDLLDGSQHALGAYSSLSLPEPVRAIEAYTFFELSDPSTTLALLSLADHPIRLVNALALDSGTVASYPYIRPETEEFVAAQSLVFTPDARHFLAGANSEVALFDISRPGQHAIQRFKLQRQNQFKQRGQWHLKRSIVSAMATSADEVLAIGTFGREVALIGQNGRGDVITSFELSSSARGAGVSQVSWSPCGRYLLVGERKSDAIQVFDIRGQHKLLSTLVGRKANTMMTLKWDLGPDGNLWAGGTAGNVRCWEEVGLAEGEVSASLEWHAHIDPVISTSIHQSGSVAITASATDRNKLRTMGKDDADQAGQCDFGDTGVQTSSLALWALPAREASANDLPLPSLRING